ncbi:C-GCAxxG-C-C family protein [uncultured Ruthenibacterium sp.]|uniref:C-GCAxxG-C-C family protein n=1 Tax=uncultured Ruthenibacterium sp. TaxID=1905347 RepID=UPI00349E61D5
MSVHGDEAHRLFYSGYNCAQSVACAFAGDLGLPVETVAQMISGFGAGVGRLREVCGCISGMTFVYGFLRGYGTPDDPQAKTATYAAIQTLADTFRQRSGSIVCKELLGLDTVEITPQSEARTPEYYEKRPCPELVRYAADILEEYLREVPSCNSKAL